MSAQTQALSWLQAQLAAGGAAPEVAALHDARFATTLELAVRFGKVRRLGTAVCLQAAW